MRDAAVIDAMMPRLMSLLMPPMPHCLAAAASCRHLFHGHAATPPFSR